MFNRQFQKFTFNRHGLSFRFACFALPHLISWATLKFAMPASPVFAGRCKVRLASPRSTEPALLRIDGLSQNSLAVLRDALLRLLYSEPMDWTELC
jgi:hypothetical protein